MSVPAKTSGSKRVGAEREGRDDPEVAAAAAQAPEQVRVLGGARRTCSPLARTTSAETRLSIVRPYRRVSQPTPPPSVRPAMPVPDTTPIGTASANGSVARSMSPSVAPAPTRTSRALGIDLDAR